MMEAKADKLRSPERVQSVDRVLTLFERLADADGPLSLSELAQLTDVPSHHPQAAALLDERGLCTPGTL
ncbi:hypothetical protein GCM10009841_19660 [Microlunatus panaciterrae]|uniref:helix-turn-helix domain-containing protein n=1 Tax=Microlunatus panaciterrae TaxID=400768 RepID=UPI003371D160